MSRNLAHLKAVPSMSTKAQPVPSAEDDDGLESGPEISPHFKSTEVAGDHADNETAALKPITIDSTTEVKAEPKAEKRVSLSPVGPKQWSYDESAGLEPKVKVQRGSEQTLYFRRKDAKGPRKVYFAMKVLRFSDINNVEESFRVRFHLYLNWIMTEKEYDEYMEVFCPLEI